MSTYNIRPATQEDVLDTVLSVKQFCKEVPHPAWAKVNSNKINKLVSELIDNPSGFVTVVTYDEEIVGCLIAVLTELPINDMIFSQELMFWLDPNHRNGKTATKLIDLYTSWSKQNGCNFVRLSELDSVLGGKAGLLFKRKGFNPVETAYIKEV